MTGTSKSPTFAELLDDLAKTHRPVWSSSDLNYYVAQRGGLTPRAARRLINRLIAMNYIQKIEDGYYTIKLNQETLQEAKDRLNG